MNKQAKAITAAFLKAGHKGEVITVPLRKCQDVPQFLAKFRKAQQATGKSKLVLK